MTTNFPKWRLKLKLGWETREPGLLLPPVACLCKLLIHQGLWPSFTAWKLSFLWLQNCSSLFFTKLINFAEDGTKLVWAHHKSLAGWELLLRNKGWNKYFCWFKTLIKYSDRMTPIALCSNHPCNATIWPLNPQWSWQKQADTFFSSSFIKYWH